MNLAQPMVGATNDSAGHTPERARTHVIDRIASWTGIAGAAVFLVFAIFGWSQLSDLLATGRIWILLGIGLSFAVTTAALVFRLIISPAVGNQIRELVEVAESITAGDLTLRPAVASQGGQLGRLARAMVQMTTELSRLVTLIRDHAAETARRSTEITGGTEHMAETAASLAHTAGSLSVQASDMAGTISLLSIDAGRLSTLASSVSAGAADGISRNKRIKGLSTESHERLDESSRRLEALVADVQASARSTESLAAASDQIRGFVVLVQKIARQSKLLALNAAMEAARAGEQGEGFTVVANEVRRLAQNTAEAAEQTHQVMQDLISQMESARQTSARSLTAVESVRAATLHGRQAFTQVELAVDEADQWAATMATSSAAGKALATEITAKLDSLSSGTEAFAGAMHDVAAASQEQSASTQEIAAAANALVSAADKVSGAARAFGDTRGR